MPVSDFECQIARGQIGRYLDGGVLSPQALAGLEEHLAECPSCKAAVAERRAALLGTLGAPSHAVVSMPVENPLVAALRARAEEEPAATPKAQPVPQVETPAKAAPRYAKAPKTAAPKTASAPNTMAKPLALAALLAVVLLGMGRLSHTLTSPAAKASSAFAAGTLPETPAKPAKTELPKPKEPQAPTTIPKAAPASVIPAAKVAEPTPAKPVAVKAEAKTSAPRPVSKPSGSLGDLFEPNAPTKPKVVKTVSVPKKPVAPKARVTKPRLIVAKPKPVLRRTLSPVRRVKTLRRPIALHHPKVVRHAKVVRRAPRSSVRVYGLDGRPLKP